MIHSAYNPQNEAKVFVQSTEIPFKAQTLVILEPGLSYCAPFFREKFPGIRLCAVRFTNAFSEADTLFDAVFHLFSADERHTFEAELQAFFKEDGILYAHFAQWLPCAKIFAELSDIAWAVIKKQLELSQTILNTNGYFSKRWLKNAVAFIRNGRHFATIERGTEPVLIAASGTSLSSSLYEIQKIRNRVFLIAVSSALSPLLHHGITPDLVISTDGGYWAKLHLTALLKQHGIPLALSAEGAAFSKILSQSTIVPLSYQDGAGSALLPRCGIPSFSAERNGTVSGTALEAALSMTSGPVFLCGLDLASARGFQHTMPNALDSQNDAVAGRLCTKETRITRSRFNAGALAVYEAWFSRESSRFSARAFRLSAGFSYANTLGSIRDIDFSEAKRMLPKSFTPIKISCSEAKTGDAQQNARRFLKEKQHDEAFIKECFPIEYLSYRRTGDPTLSREQLLALQKKACAFITTLIGI